MLKVWGEVEGERGEGNARMERRRGVESDRRGCWRGEKKESVGGGAVERKEESTRGRLGMSQGGKGRRTEEPIGKKSGCAKMGGKQR